MYVIGGFNGALNEHYNDLYEFDPATEVWTKVNID